MNVIEITDKCPLCGRFVGLDGKAAMCNEEVRDETLMQQYDMARAVVGRATELLNIAVGMSIDDPESRPAIAGMYGNAHNDLVEVALSLDKARPAVSRACEIIE